jgi:GcrA cell cycle regulator
MEWTEERVDKLKALWAEGHTASEISHRLGVTRNAVIGKVHRLGLGGRTAAAAPRTIFAHTPHRSQARSNWRSATPSVTPPPHPRFTETSAAPTAILLTLNPHSCRWPIGHPDDPDFGFCGRHREGSASYCADHRHIALRRSSISQVELTRLTGLR